MKLILASRAAHPDTLSTINTRVGGLKGKSIAYIVTAGNGEGWGSWNGKTLQEVKNTGADINIVQLEDYYNKDILEDLEKNEIIWFAGGYAGYLMYWIRRTGLDTVLPKLLESRLYVGTSAGAWITSQTLEVAEFFLDGSERGATFFPGLGYIDFDIYPHYEDYLYDQVKSLYKGKKLYLLKDGEEIIVEDNKITVVGEERIIVNG
ncbi:Type 1 glutamine amidotransferase-like domain-containing protein [Candidatus Dojkabacteria bacterium]|nr:Type 1 glutamine amidotransferase-like domain-containing protein [Candidatus Dojkabacteria bacterium]